jgi:putative acetyltransferase
MISYLTATTNQDFNIAAELFKQYAEWLNIDLSFQHFDEELGLLETMYAAPYGGIVLCKLENEFIGCVGIRRIDDDTAELKRMFIQPAYQKRGTGKILLDKAIELAERLSYKTIRLDTLNYMAAAINLYKRRGFYEISAYYYNPNNIAM